MFTVHATIGGPVDRQTFFAHGVTELPRCPYGHARCGPCATARLLDDFAALPERARTAIFPVVKLSRASTYAFYGLSYLAGQPPGLFVPLSEIHRHYGVPEKHLAKIFQQLVRAGLLSSARGVQGGFTLARAPEKISPLEVIEAIEGPLDVGCLLIGEPCEHDVACRINGVWRRAQHAMVKVLREASLADMVQVRRFRPPRGPRAAELVTLRLK
jgi:Rrf2 family protein